MSSFLWTTLRLFLNKLVLFCQYEKSKLFKKKITEISVKKGKVKGSI